MADEMKRMGKYVSMLLRHHPEEAGVVLDEHGWTDVADLVEKVRPRYPLTEELLHQLAFGKDKQRYEFSEDGKKVRAVHGHSVEVDLGYEETQPPAVLFHGSATKFQESIAKSGLQKQNRQYVHLSENIEQAKAVGSRHGKLVLYQIDAKKMYEDDYKFYRSTSGVWLTDHVPVQYMQITESPFHDIMTGLNQAIEIEKGNIEVVEVPGMPAKTYRSFATIGGYQDAESVAKLASQLVKMDEE